MDIQEVKLALLLILLGGSASNEGDERTQCHLLLIGEPGCGKSELLRWAEQSQRSGVMASGLGASSAGLTVSLAKDKNGVWGVEAGALALAD